MTAATTLRVTNIEAITTLEGDLIVSGTTGTVIEWDGKNLVRVKWDAYVFARNNEHLKVCVNTGLIVETEYKNLKFKG